MTAQSRSTRRPHAVVALFAGTLLATALLPAARGAASEESAMRTVIPAPASVWPNPDADTELTRDTAIRIEPRRPDSAEAGTYLAGILRRSTGFPLPVIGGPARPGDIGLRLDGDRAQLGPSGYRLRVADKTVTVQATSGDGLFNGIQTLRQILPAAAESASVRPGPWTVSGGDIIDRPRFAQRGAMLDVARHFFDVDTVKRYIDQIALYKINQLHLHLTDDQGWRLQITSWPRLAEHGGSTQVGGGPGGYYTQQDYKEITAYAASRHITVVPEIDIPGHTNAALASYAELNCNGVAPPLYTGTDVGFSSLCVNKDITYRFVADVIRELAALTPGPYLHIGGDEAHSTSEGDYKKFMAAVTPLAEKYGKTAIGWHEYVKAAPKPPSVAQYWGAKNADPLMTEAAARGNKILQSAANRSYLDMKYDKNTPLGTSWAGYIEVRDAYDWNPGEHLQGVPAEAVSGVEAPLWSETLRSSRDVEYMAFPRLPAIAELGWSPASTHDWESFRQRLAAQSPRWTELGINFYRSPQIPWPSD